MRLVAVMHHHLKPPTGLKAMLLIGGFPIAQFSWMPVHIVLFGGVAQACGEVVNMKAPLMHIRGISGQTGKSMTGNSMN